MQHLLIRVAAIFGVAILLTAPAAVSPPMTHDSFWIDWVWADQFTNELAKGHLYPRWLPLSHNGLGSPVFYYYPPLSFHLVGALGLFGLSTYASLVGAFFLAFVGSGLAMYAWLRETAPRPLLGALLFMAAPYHVLDFYGRGALAEFLAIALIPLVALGLRRAAEGRFVLAALSYAALIMAHLPLALLVSVFFIVPYAIYMSRGRPGLLLSLGTPLAVGVAIAGIYLVPALLLEPFRDAGKLWHRAAFQPQNFSLLPGFGTGFTPTVKAVIASALLPLLFGIVGLFLAGSRRWSLYATVCCALAAGLVPVLWNLPLLHSVQFPFRLLPLAEFAIATGFAHLATSRLLAYAATVPMLTASVVYAIQPKTAPLSIAELAAVHPDVPENLPRGFSPYNWPSWPAVELARSHKAPRQVGGHTVDTVFYFPAWEVRCDGRAVPTSADPQTKLLRYEGTNCERRLKMTGVETIGAAISLAGLLALLLLTYAPRTMRRRRPVSERGGEAVGHLSSR